MCHYIEYLKAETYKYLYFQCNNSVLHFQCNKTHFYYPWGKKQLNIGASGMDKTNLKTSLRCKICAKIIW